MDLCRAKRALQHGEPNLKGMIAGIWRTSDRLAFGGQRTDVLHTGSRKSRIAS